jgi:hypothetical protein
MAGHTVAGAYCDCGTVGCIYDCDNYQEIREENPTQPEVPGQTSPEETQDSDLGVSLMFGALLIALLLRMTT